jgi:glycosyltransferase involved in cell wall biosynthesis
MDSALGTQIKKHMIQHNAPTMDISVIISAYTEERWDELNEAIQSVQQQTLPASEIIVVIDHNPDLLVRVRQHLPGVIVVENSEAQGLRGARNCGIAAASGQIVAFLDDDAVAIPEWLNLLCQGYRDARVLGTGGGVTPAWAEAKPAWLPEEFYWVVGCSYRGMPQHNARIRNPIGANMSFRRELFELVGDFHSDITLPGKRHAGGCEETEFCIRAHQRWPQGCFLYKPQANVFHRVPASRARWRYFCGRCYIEGLAKAVIARDVGEKDGLSSERGYTLRTLPQGVIRNLLDGILRLDSAGIARAGAIVVGLACTTAGFVIGNLSLAFESDRRNKERGASWNSQQQQKRKRYQF